MAEAVGSWRDLARSVAAEEGRGEISDADADRLLWNQTAFGVSSDVELITRQLREALARP